MRLTNVFPDSFFAEEYRPIKISANRKRLWAVQLDLLIEFDRVCKANDIKYTLDAGTLLGAARHKGFIPWDDDVDVAMLREEYEKLDRIASKEFKEPYFWQTFRTDPDHGRGFARLRNSSTSYIRKVDLNGERSFFSHNQGVFIDIFISDKVPDDAEERASFMDKLASFQDYALHMRVQKAVRLGLRLFFHPRSLAWKLKQVLYNRILGIDIVSRVREKLDKMAQTYRDSNVKEVSRLTFCADRRDRLSACVPLRFFEELTSIEFEGHLFSATRHWDEYLTIMYGDWHEQKITHDPSGDAYIDLENSYVKYLPWKEDVL